MATVKKSRLQMLQLRKKLGFVKHGAKILSDKRDALMKEFYGLARELHENRKELNQKISASVKSLRIAESMEPRESLTSSALVSQKKTLFEGSIKRVWGVKIPVARYEPQKRAVFDRGSLPGYRSPSVDSAADKFEIVVNALVESAVLENRLLRFGEAIKATSRKVNALEQRLEPEIKNEIKIISDYLEEKPREEIFRMKRYKTLREKQ